MDQQEYEHLLALSERYCRRMVGITGADRTAAQRTAIAYAAMRARQCSAPVLDNLDRLIEQFRCGEQEQKALHRLLKPSDLGAVRRLSSRHTEDQLQAYILFCAAAENLAKGTEHLPRGLALLGAALLGGGDEHTYADLCCGSGEFMVEAFPVLGGRTVAAFEPDRDKAAAALLRTSLLGGTYRVICRDVLRQPSAARFDRIFLHPSLEEQRDRVAYEGPPQAPEDVPDLSQMSQVWLHTAEAVRMLKPGGKALALVPAGVLGQVVDRLARKSYITTGLIESVVLLPSGLLPGADTPCALLCLSEGNESVRLIDARSMATQRGRERFLDAADIENIVACFDETQDRAVQCTLEQLREADWSLLPTRYLNRTEIPYARPLESVATRIERGAQISTAKLEEVRSAEPTTYRYLRIADIEDGTVNAEDATEFLSGISDAARNRCIHDGTVVLSRLGTPTYKSGVAHVPADEYIVAPGNVYLIDVDPDSMDPYFLQAFLQSEAGVASLQRLGGTSAVRPIALGDLRRMLVPAPPLEIQKKIAQHYREASARCTELRSELREAGQMLSGVYDSVDILMD